MKVLRIPMDDLLLGVEHAIRWHFCMRKVRLLAKLATMYGRLCTSTMYVHTHVPSVIRRVVEKTTLLSLILNYCDIYILY